MRQVTEQAAKMLQSLDVQKEAWFCLWVGGVSALGEFFGFDEKLWCEFSLAICRPVKAGGCIPVSLGRAIPKIRKRIRLGQGKDGVVGFPLRPCKVQTVGRPTLCACWFPNWGKEPASETPQALERGTQSLQKEQREGADHVRSPKRANFGRWGRGCHAHLELSIFTTFLDG